MAVASTDSDAYYRVYKALHLVTHEAIPCVDNCLKIWHATQQQHLQPCTTGQCPDGKKPKLLASCANCVAWEMPWTRCCTNPPKPLPPAIAPVGPTGVPQPQPYQQANQQLSWPNVRQSKLRTSHVEVAKAFVLRLPNKTSRFRITFRSSV